VDKARDLVEAHVLEGRSVSRAGGCARVHRSWIYKLEAVARTAGDHRHHFASDRKQVSRM
jgi:hypothetical protein